MFQNNFPNMNFNQMNQNFNYNILNPMMNNLMINQMNYMPFNQMNPNLMNDFQSQTEEEDYIYLFDINKHLMEEYHRRLNFIADQKKKINFTNMKKDKILTLSFPIFFTKNELYSYINRLDSRIAVLFYGNNILNNDDSSIQDIPDNSTIILFNRPSPDYMKSSLYKYIMNLFPNKNFCNIGTEDLDSGATHNYVFNEDFSVSLIVKFISIILNLDNNSYLLFGGKKWDFNDNTKIKDIFGAPNKIKIIHVKNLIGFSDFKGKEIKATMFYKNKDIFKSKLVSKYTPISSLFTIFLDDDSLKNNNIIYNGNILNKNDNHSLASLGIKDDFECIIK